MKNIRNMQIVLVMSLCFIILIFTMAFSLKSEQLLKVSNHSSIKKWNTFVENVSAVMVGNATYKMPTVQKKSIENFQVVLNGPGDKVSFRFKISNRGNASCVISNIKQVIHCNKDSLEKNKKICESINYSLKYENGISVKVGDAIPDDSIKNVRLTIEYPTNFSSSNASPIVIEGDILSFDYKDK